MKKAISLIRRCVKKHDSEKIKAMLKEERGEWIKAIDKLVESYERNLPYPAGCPLCVIAKKMKRQLENCCSSCLWVIFENIQCGNFAGSMGLPGVPEDRGKDFNKWKHSRLPALRYWKKILQKEG